MRIIVANLSWDPTLAGATPVGRMLRHLHVPIPVLDNPFLDGLVSHLWLDDGRLVVAHAGLHGITQTRHRRLLLRFRRGADRE
jgi:hypothetical protein